MTSATRAPGACPTCGHRSETDALARARQTIEDVMDGLGGRGAQARIRAAELILGLGLLKSMSDDDLLAEVRRRGLAR